MAVRSASGGGKMFKVTLAERLTVFKERMLFGGRSNEPAEFLVVYNKLVRLREQLHTVEKGIKLWAKSSKSLSNSAAFLARAVETDQEVYLQLVADMQAQLDDRTTSKAIRMKISMLDELVRDRKVLITLRHLRNRQARKVKAAMEKDLDEESKNKVLRAETAAKVRYDEHYAQLLASLRFVVGEADEKGHCSLISPELAAFKLEQFQFFLNCQKIIQGSEKDDARNLSEEWNQFTSQLDSERQDAKTGVARAYEAELQAAFSATGPPTGEKRISKRSSGKRSSGKRSHEPAEDFKSDHASSADEQEEDEHEEDASEDEATPVSPQILGGRNGSTVDTSKRAVDQDDDDDDDDEEEEEEADDDDEQDDDEEEKSEHRGHATKSTGHAAALKEKLAQAMRG